MQSNFTFFVLVSYFGVGYAARHQLQKRQTFSGAPVFSQGSYQFTLPSCNAGTTIGTVTTSTTTAGQVGYSIDTASVYGYFAVVDYITGRLSLSTNLIYSPVTFNVLAANANGVTSVPVTISCSGGSNTIFGSTGLGTTTTSTQTITGTSCFPGAVVGTVSSTAGPVSGYTISGNNQFIINANSGQISVVGGTALTGGTYSVTVQAYLSNGQVVSIPVTITLSCTGTTGTGTFGAFSQSSYFFTSSSCFAGSSVGSVFANGATNYFITGGTGQFSVSPSGLITTSTTLQAGTYTFSVQSSTGATVPVTVTVSCSGTGTGTGTGFGQSSYFFTTSSCFGGSSVGSVFSSGSTNFFITNSNGQFLVNPSGLITVATSIGSGTYTFNVQNSFGQTVPVTVTATCTGTGTGTGFGQSSYTFTTSSCTPGTSVGQVFASGATNYFISAGTGQQFFVSSTGQITINTTPASGTYTFTVQSSTGATVPVTVTVNCGGTGTTGFAQSSYTFTTSTCTPGTSVGQVFAIGATNYFISAGTGQQFFVSSTGQITINTTPASGTYTFTVQSSTGATVPVTVTVNCGGTGTTGFAQSSYTFTTSTCTPGTSVGQVFAIGATNYFISAGTGQQFFVSANGQITINTTPASGTYTFTVQASTGATVPVTVTVNCGGTGTTGFSQSSYSFTSSGCFAGSAVGSVFSSGSTNYLITSGTGQFLISPTGVITLATTVPAGTYSLTVQNSFGQTVPVTVVVSCTGTGTTGTSLPPLFNQPSYAFTLTSCNNIGTGTTIGSVTAAGATTYSIGYGNNFFTIDGNGNLSAIAGLTPGTYGLSVVASSGVGGAQRAVPVAVTVSCTG